MNRFAKIITGLVFAAAAAFPMTATPTLADTGCGCGDEGYDDYYAYGWNDVGQDVEIYNGGTIVYELYFDGHQTVDIGLVSEWIQGTYNVDLDITVVTPDGREITADQEGDDELTIRTGQGGTFTVYVDNYDQQLGTYFYLYVV